MCIHDYNKILYYSILIYSIGIFISLNGTLIEPESKIFIGDIHQLVCITDKNPCCKHPNSTGDWIFPDGVIIGNNNNKSNTEDFYTDKGHDGNISLYRFADDVVSPTGRFCCMIPDATNKIYTLCVNIGEIHA